MNNFEPCMETVENMIDKFEEDLRLIALQAEIADVKGTISNERLWQKGCNTQEEIDIYEQNIADYEAYLEWLEDEEIEIRRA